MGSVLPMIFDLVSESLKGCTPNMKKKKAPEFDELKAKVIKPMKEMVNSFKNFFESISQFYAEFKEKDLFSEEEAVPEELLAYLKQQRLRSINKEYKSSMDRFRDISDKLAKRYQALAVQSKGFSI